MKLTQLIPIFCILVGYATIGGALKCFTCHSLYDPFCANVTETEMNMVLCDMPSHIISSDKEMGCLATLMDMDEHKDVYVRNCTILEPEQKATLCETAKKTPEGMTLKKCYLCFTDGCNAVV